MDERAKRQGPGAAPKETGRGARRKEKNPLSYLGWVGMIGVLGLLTAPSIYFLTYLLFFFFFSYRKMPADELFWQNVRRAGLRAFAAGAALGVVWLLVILGRGIWLTQEGLLFHTRGEMQAALDAAGATVTLPVGTYSQISLTATGLVWSLVLSLAVFIFTLMHFNRQERKYTEPEEPVC